MASKEPLAPFSVRLQRAAELASGEETVTSYLGKAAHGVAPSDAANKLFAKTFAVQRFFQRFRLKKDLYEGHAVTKEDLDVAAKAGKWSRRPSDLFLKIFADALVTLQRDPLAGVVSPPLLGSEGTVPLSIVSVIPDIMQHYYDCIVRAEHEVILLTNYWQPSNSVSKIASAMKELSKRQVAKQKRAVFKLLIDRGALKQLINPHVDVPSTQWKPLDIPAPDEIPGLQLEVQNYHKIAMGTMHTKLLVVDRFVGCVNSNNIQDRPNLEMMVHLEGPIVQSLYDTALLTWNEVMRPAMPLIRQPAPEVKYTFAEANPYLANIDLVRATRAAKKLLHQQIAEAKAEGQQQQQQQQQRAKSNSAMGLADVVAAMQRGGKLSRNTTRAATAPPRLSNGGPPDDGSAAPANAVSRPEEEQHAEPFTPGERTSGTPLSAVPTASAYGQSEPSVISNPGTAPRTPPMNGTMPHSTAPPLVDYPENATRAMPSHAKSELSEEAFSGRMRALSDNFNRGANAPTLATLPLELYDDQRQFAPHRFHKAHNPVPIALVNRKPHGMPGHSDIRNPQDAAWLAALRYAEKHVFIQTPTLNAHKVIEGILGACRRKVRVILYLDLGFNDKSESFLFQGGTNQEVVKKLFAALRKEHKQYLELYWYTGADQIRPLHAIHKRRNCHVKFMSCDSRIAILGNGNQDTQSWCHSQECNILVDSETIVKDWEAMLAANQNTGRFGRTSDDGIWRDVNGKTVEELDAIELSQVTPKDQPHDPPVEQPKELLANDAA